MRDKELLEQLAGLVRERRPVAVLTGAGVSTDSGIPDYRGAGSPPRTPMNIDEFLGDLAFRRRFWAGAALNFRTAPKVSPNEGHRALVALEQEGLINGVITQNVDNLHLEAGTQRVVELHGNGARIRCVDCGSVFTRGEVISWFEKANPGYMDSQSAVVIAPDGDADVTGFEHLRVPVCPVCTGTLRPEVVYFGETVPAEVFTEAEQLVSEAGALMIVGSSLAVNTGMRLVHRARKRDLPLMVINRGPTAVDARADLRIESGASEALTELVRLVTHRG